MYFDYTEEHDMLRDATRGHLERHDPIARLRTDPPFDRAARRKTLELDAQQGWMAMLAPEEFGGAGGTIVEAMVVAEELGRAASAFPFASVNAVAWCLATVATPAQRDALLPGLASGGLVVANAVQTSAGAWAGETVGVTASSIGGGVRLQGRARLVQDADLADHLLVPAQTDGGVIQVMVPSAAAGLSVRSEKTIDLTRRHCEVSFEGVEVSADEIIGGGRDAAAALRAQAQIASVLTSADSVGAAARLLDMTVAYAKDRHAFGKPIAAFQAVKHRCAEMLIQLETARVAVWYAAVALRDDRPDAVEAASTAKFFATEAASWVAGQALQLHGGIGFTWEHDVHLFLKRAKANEALWGSAASHRERVAEQLAL